MSFTCFFQTAAFISFYFSSWLFHVIGGLEYSWILSFWASISSNLSFPLFLLLVCPGRITASVCLVVQISSSCLIFISRFTYMYDDRSYYLCRFFFVRAGMMGWLLINLSILAKSVQDDSLSQSMILYQIFCAVHLVLLTAPASEILWLSVFC